jgi:hypothetical protein
VRAPPGIPSLIFFAGLLGACQDGAAPTADASDFQLPTGDPNGGAVTGTLTTDLADTTSGQLFLGAFAPATGELLVGVALGEVVFPYTYRLDAIPGGQQVIRALLDFSPYAARPLVDAAGAEDAIGVYLNASSILPVSVRPGLVTSRVSFFVTR